MEAVNPYLKSMPVEIKEEYLNDQAELLFSIQKENSTVISRRLLYFIVKK